MPSPIAHSAAGLAIYIASRDNFETRPFGLRDMLLGAYCAFLANLPDLDFVPGIFIGRANAYHHGVTHSILFGLLAGPVCYAFAYRLFREAPVRRGLLCCTAAVLSHILLDYISQDSVNPGGLPLFWPFSATFHVMPIPLFGDITRSGRGGFLKFMHSLFNANNLRSAVVELCFSLAVLSAAFGWKLRSKRTLRAATVAVFLVCAFLYYRTLCAFVH